MKRYMFYNEESDKYYKNNKRKRAKKGIFDYQLELTHFGMTTQPILPISGNIFPKPAPLS